MVGVLAAVRVGRVQQYPYRILRLPNSNFYSACTYLKKMKYYKIDLLYK